MKFMVLIKADANSEAGTMPDERLLTEMGAFNQQLADAGVLLAGEGLHPSSRGARVRFAGGEHTVQSGPFPADGGLVAGFWIWRVDSLDGAIEWVKRMPHPMPGTETEVEIRQVFDADDFGEAFTPELREQEERLRAQTSNA